MEQIIHSPKLLGKAIRRWRKLKNLSQQEAGSPMKLEQSTVSTIEQGVPGTRIETLFRILAALDLEMVIRPKNNSKVKGEW